jgi:hypothetical protein
MHSTEDVESTALARKDEPSLTCDIYIYIYIYIYAGDMPFNRKYQCSSIVLDNIYANLTIIRDDHEGAKNLNRK